MKTFKKILPGLIVLLLLSGMVYRFLSTKIQQAESSEVTLGLNAYATAEENYYKTYIEYSSDKDKLASTFSSEKIEIYLKEEDVPKEYIEQLHENVIPYASKKSFKILGTFKDTKERKIYMWTIDNRRVIDYIGFLSY